MGGWRREWRGKLWVWSWNAMKREKVRDRDRDRKRRKFVVFFFPSIVAAMRVKVEEENK